MSEIGRKISALISRCVLGRSAAASDGVVRHDADYSAGEHRSGVEMFQQFGLASIPLPGAEGVTLFIGGDRAHGVTVATEDARHRPADLLPGEICVYSAFGSAIYLRTGGIVEIKAPGGVVVSGNMSVNGSIVGASVADAVGNLVQMRVRTETHIHAGGSLPSGTTGPAVPGP